MNRLKDLMMFLVLEVAGVVVAAVSFSVIPTKVIAGAVAGGFFLLTGLYMLFRTFKWRRCWESWTVYPLLIYLFGCTIPMLWERFSHWDRPFSELKVWGIPGPEFHHISSSTLGLLFLVTLAEVIREITKNKARA